MAAAGHPARTGARAAETPPRRYAPSAPSRRRDPSAVFDSRTSVTPICSAVTDSRGNPPRRQTLTDLRRQKTITFIVCTGLGLAIDGETIPYVAGWGEHGALEAVNEFAGTIDRLARRIEEALVPASSR